MKITKILKNRKQCWRVNFHLGGRQYRRFFQTESEAHAFSRSKQDAVEAARQEWAMAGVVQGERMILGKPAVFHPPDAEFVRAFNSTQKLLGCTISDLSVEAIRAGIKLVLKKRKAALLRTERAIGE